MPKEPGTEEEVLDRGDNVPTVDDASKVKTDDDSTKALAGDASKTKVSDTPASKESESEPSGKMVPLTRFQAQNVRLREQEKTNEELKTRLEELERKQTTSTPTKEDVPKVRDFVAEAAEVEKQFEAAIADNDIAAVAKANRELRAIDRAELEHRLTEAREPAAKLQQSIAMKEFNETLEAVESEYPELNPDSETANKGKIEAAQALVRAFENDGHSSSDALIKAVSVLYPETPAAAVPAAAAAPVRGLKEKIAAAAATPPNLSKAGGENSDAAGVQSELNPAQLSDQEFDDLPEAMKKRLRGDVAA